ncbi:hypothetical protein Peur_004646 [Populus x canadensis]
MIPCKSKFSCIGFPRHLVGVMSLLQYKTFSRIQLLNNNNNNNKKTVLLFNKALTLSHVRSVTFVVPSCSWYTQLAIHIDVSILTISHNLKFGHPFKESFVEVNCSLTSAIPFECHQPKLIIRLSWSSIRMSLAKAIHSFVPVIHSAAISQS